MQRSVWFVFCLVTILFVGCFGEDHRLSEWEDLVEKKVTELRRNKRSVLEPEVEIENLQQHYTTAFKHVNNNYHNRFATFQEYGELQDVHMGDVQAPVQGRYIVMLQSDTSNAHLDHTIRVLERANVQSEGNLVAKHIKPFRTVGKGFTATLGRRVVALLMEHPLQFSIEQDVAIKRHSRDHNGDEEQVFAEGNVPWNLDRLDQHKHELDGHYTPSGTGKGVDVYILDTGIRYTHKDLNGRAHYAGYDAIDELLGTQSKGSDCNSHGTHCAATVAGEKFGVAKKANLYAARVLDCTGTGAVSGIIDTMEFIINKRKKEGKTNRAVFSMSLGVERSEGFNNAANAASEKGIVVVAASGNQGKNSCDYSPGSATMAVSVAASDVRDNAVMFSNLGKCVTVFAPGASITSASHVCDTCTMTKSGTSMACPHAAGLAAIILSLNPGLSASEVKNHISQQATENAIQIQGYMMAENSMLIQETTPNLLLYVSHK